jgi:glycosyltransferase involved in cell wall biosynthesis
MSSSYVASAERSHNQEVTIVIPTLNEEIAIADVIDAVRSAGYDQILVVDGYSTDRTVEQAKAKSVRVITQVGVGKGGAIQTAIDSVETPLLVVMDGDGTYPPEYISRLVEHSKGYDEVIGARQKGRNFIPRLNRVGNWIITKTFNLLFSVTISDVLSGMYLLRTSSAKKLRIEALSFDVEVEIACKIAATGKIGEVPITYGKRLGKQKLSSRKHGPRILATMVWMAHYYNPVVLYSLLLALAAIPGVSILLWVLAQDIYYHIWHSGYALFSVMLLLLGSQAGAVGLISLLIKRSENRLLRLMSQTDDFDS